MENHVGEASGVSGYEQKSTFLTLVCHSGAVHGKGATSTYLHTGRKNLTFSSCPVWFPKQKVLILLFQRTFYFAVVFFIQTYFYRLSTFHFLVRLCRNSFINQVRSIFPSLVTTNPEVSAWVDAAQTWSEGPQQPVLLGKGRREHRSPSPADKITCRTNICSKVKHSLNNQFCGFQSFSGGNLQQNHFHCCLPGWKHHRGRHLSLFHFAKICTNI